MEQPPSIDSFIQRWQGVTASELATAQSFVMDLCEQLGVPKPEGTHAPSAVPARPWPTGLPEQIKAVADVIAQRGASVSLDELAAHFSSRGRWRERLPTLVDTLVALGRLRASGNGRWVDAGR